MKMSEYLQKRKMLFIITFIVVALLIVISIIVFKDKKEDKDSIKEQDLSIVYNISKDESSPMDKINGVENAKISTIKIKNNKDYKQKYQLIIKPDDKSTLELNKIYIYINDEVKILSDYQDGIVYEDTIDNKKEKIISFKTWIGSDLIDENDKDKIISLNYEIKKQD